MNPVETLDAYVRAFETLDPNKFVSYYYLPCQFVTPAGVFPLVDAAALQAFAGGAVQQAKAQGYCRTESVGAIRQRSLTDHLAELSGAYRRLNADGEEITRFGFTYLLRNSDAGWQIVVATIHDVLSAEAV